MNNRYIIWDKVSTVYTPSGAEFTPEQWMIRYKWINNPNMIPIMAAGPFNGAVIDELSRMKLRAEQAGATFDEGLSNEELLDAIVAFDDEKNAEAINTPTDSERIAAAMEFQNLLAM